MDAFGAFRCVWTGLDRGSLEKFGGVWPSFELDGGLTDWLIIGVWSGQINGFWPLKNLWRQFLNFVFTLVISTFKPSPLCSMNIYTYLQPEDPSEKKMFDPHKGSSMVKNVQCILYNKSEDAVRDFDVKIAILGNRASSSSSRVIFQPHLACLLLLDIDFKSCASL